MADTAQVLDSKVTERLDRLDWDRLSKDTGLTRKDIEANPRVASQLAYGRVTDLLDLKLDGLKGKVALRAYPKPVSSNDPWYVKPLTIGPKLSEKDRIFVQGEEIYSEKLKEALFKKRSYVRSDGKRVYGLENASIKVGVYLKKRDAEGHFIPKKDENGEPVYMKNKETGEFITDKKGNKLPEYEHESEKTEYLISLHEDTNTIVETKVESLKAAFKNGRSMYGVEMTDKQLENALKGYPVILRGTMGKEGEFETHPGLGTVLQYSAVKADFVPVYPEKFRENEAREMKESKDVEKKAGETQSQAKTQTRKATASKKTAAAEAPAKKTRMKRN